MKQNVQEAEVEETTSREADETKCAGGRGRGDHLQMASAQDPIAEGKVVYVNEQLVTGVPDKLLYSLYLVFVSSCLHFFPLFAPCLVCH